MVHSTLLCILSRAALTRHLIICFGCIPESTVDGSCLGYTNSSARQHGSSPVSFFILEQSKLRLHGKEGEIYGEKKS